MVLPTNDKPVPTPCAQQFFERFGRRDRLELQVQRVEVLFARNGQQLTERLAASIGLPVATARARVERMAVSAAARPGPEPAA
jgi:hypothetical protein